MENTTQTALTLHETRMENITQDTNDLANAAPVDHGWSCFTPSTTAPSTIDEAGAEQLVGEILAEDDGDGEDGDSDLDDQSDL